MSDALEMAVFFHETYERLAPSFGYATREDTKQFDPSSNNGRLMQAVCAAWLEQRDARIRELEQWKQAVIDGLVAAEIYRDAHESDPKAALKDLIQWRGLFKEGLNAMIMVRVLESKISAHEKVCAGTWIRCSERLPPLGWHGPVLTGGYGDGIHGTDMDMYVDYRSVVRGAGSVEPCEPHWWYCEDAPDGVTHWLDAKQPDEDKLCQ